MTGMVWPVRSDKWKAPLVTRPLKNTQRDLLCLSYVTQCHNSSPLSSHSVKNAIKRNKMLNHDIRCEGTDLAHQKTRV